MEMELLKMSRKSKDKIICKDEHYFSISKKFVHNISISRDARFLFLVLKSYTYDKKREAFPGRELLSKVLGCSQKSLSKYLDELQYHGFIAKKRFRRDDGTYEHNLYEITENSRYSQQEIFSDGKTENLSNGTYTNMVNDPTKLLKVFKLIDLSVYLIKNFNYETEVSNLAKVVNKFSKELGEKKIKQIIFTLAGKEKQFDSINDLAAYLQACKSRETEPAKEMEFI